MRTDLQLVLCLLITTLFSVPGINWKNKKRTHRGKTISTSNGLKYFAQRLSNERNFESNLDAILIPRTVGSRNHDRVRQHIKQAMSNSGWNVQESSFTDQTPLGRKKFTNIIATQDPTAPRRLVIACHYDSKIEPAGFLAATDSAVPCAMMMNLAQTMRKDLTKLRQKKSDLSLQFIFFDGEEAFKKWSSQDSIYGARNLAAKWEKQKFTHGGVSGNQNQRIDIFVLLDLLGSRDMQISQQESSTARWYDRLVSIEATLKRNNIIKGPTTFKNKRANSGIEDDHIPFKRRGVPILHLISSPFPNVWHKIGDNRNALDFNRIANFNKILRLFVAEYLHIEPMELTSDQ